MFIALTLCDISTDAYSEARPGDFLKTQTRELHERVLKWLQGHNDRTPVGIVPQEDED